MKQVTSTSAGPPRLAAEDAVRAIQQNARYFFTTEEFTAIREGDSSKVAAEKVLNRLALKGIVARATPRKGNWLVVPPEQEHYGAPPVLWWLDDFMRAQQKDYYVGLLSAARHWGSAHYAIQTTQVLVESPRPSLVVGKLKVDFFTKLSLAETPTVVVTQGVAPWKISTREATLFDLMRHQSAIGGVEAVARISRDFGPEMTGDAVASAANAMGQTAVAQRLGFIFDKLGLKHPTNRLDEWLSSRAVQSQPLEAGSALDQENMFFDERWRVWYSPRHLQQFEEIA